MKKQCATVLITTLAVSIAFVGCAGKVKYPTYYTLNVPPAPDPPAGPDARTSVAVREFRAPGYLRQGPLVYRASRQSRLASMTIIAGRRTRVSSSRLRSRNVYVPMVAWRR